MQVSSLAPTHGMRSSRWMHSLTPATTQCTREVNEQMDTEKLMDYLARKTIETSDGDGTLPCLSLPVRIHTVYMRRILHREVYHTHTPFRVRCTLCIHGVSDREGRMPPQMPAR